MASAVMASSVAWRSATAVAGLLLGKLGKLVVNKVILLWSFQDDANGLKETMELLNAMMHDADRRSGDQGATVEFWMKRFRSVAYDVEDLVDKFETIQLMKQSQSKIMLFFSSYNPLLVRLTMAHKIKNLKKDLDIIKEEGRSLHLVPNYNMSRSTEESRNLPTVAWTNENIDIAMIGRDTQKENIIKLLLKSEAEEHISIIPIVGLGGLGKTTLAQAVFSDKRTKIFDLRVWIFVSKNFDLPRIGQTIIRKARNGRSTNEEYIIPRNADLNFIIEQVNTILLTKRYLIVLDDIWEQDVDNLDKLKQMLQYGGKGSKIILTTRMQHVVEKLYFGILAKERIICPVQKSDQINLNFLSVEDCWNVMQQTVLRRHDDVSGLEGIGREIAMKCGGLPLLARSLGFLLSKNKSAEAWEDIRDKKIILEMTEDHQPQETLERLMLSYYYMPFNVKLCFTYCAVFPKDFSVSSDHLIQQWRALGYIESNDGHYCMNYLLGMSFLQISKSSQSIPGHPDAPNKVTMHDLVHDLATIIAGSELIVPDAPEKINWSRTEKNYSRHMHLINYQEQSKALKELPGKIRSLHFTQCSRLLLQQKSFSKFKYLRVLDLSGFSIEGETASSNIFLPSNIPQLMLLRYLDASGLPISALPKSLHKLQKLQTLILSNCTLETLPDNIGHLLKLYHLDLSGNIHLNKLPTLFGELSALSFLNLSGCSKVEELPESVHKLQSLRHLDMSGCCALQKLPDKFGNLPKLVFLNLSDCSKLVKLPDNLNLESLVHLNLSSCHELENLPQDFGNLHKLGFLTLSGCYKVQVLPESFCQLKHLEDLDLSDCHDLKELPGCFGNLSELQSLNVTSCSKLQSFPETFCYLFKLKNLNLSYCVRLENLPSSFGKLKLQALNVEGCYSLQRWPDSARNMTTLTQLRSNVGTDFFLRRFLEMSQMLYDSTKYYVRKTDDGDCSSIVELGKLACRELEVYGLEDIRHPELAARANLRDNAELRGLSLHWRGKTRERRDAQVLENLVPPRTLEDFSLHHYSSKFFPNWMLEISSYLPCLTSIQLYDLTECDSLPPFGRLPSLRILHMEKMPNIRKIDSEFYGEEGTCKRLRVIMLDDLENLDEWWTTRSGEEEEEFLVPNLHQLSVDDCPKLKFLPYPPKSMYWTLRNSDNVLPKHGFGLLSSSTLPFHVNILGSSFSPDVWGSLQHLTTLEKLVVWGMENPRTLPEITPCYRSLRELSLVGMNDEALPEWLGQLISLERLEIWFCPNLTYLPESIRNLHALKKLIIWGCPRLIERCRGEDAYKISHIPHVELNSL
ncbi:hypothetical protein ACP70R_033349 [Stipagrostis hirtigluma subsp. patula]